MENFGDEGLLREYKNANHYSESHAINVTNFCISNSFLVFALSDIVSNHARDRVRQAKREHKSERQKTKYCHIARILLTRLAT